MFYFLRKSLLYKKNRVYSELSAYAKTFDEVSVLPVSLTAFYGSLQNGKSLLQWATASEQDNELFEIEYGADGATFKKIGEVAAKVPANLQQHYSFVHPSPVKGCHPLH
jgi:hypothetical protein